MHRRTFLQAAGILAVGTLAPVKSGGCNGADRLKSIGIQLYTIREVMDQDPAAGLEMVAKLGYDYVEAAGYEAGKMYQLSPYAFKGLLDGNDLAIPSGHYGEQALRDDLERVLEMSSILGHAYVVLPWWPLEKRNAEGYRALIDLLNTAGEACREQGVQLAYHNHDFEFEPLADGTLPFDLILRETDPETVKIELDLYWIAKAGADYATYFREHPGRFPLWHVKDMDDTPEQFFAAVGEGTLDWPTIFGLRETAGMAHFFVEQDRTREHVLIEEQIASSFQYLRRMRY